MFVNKCECRYTYEIRMYRARGIKQWKMAMLINKKNIEKYYFNRWKNIYQNKIVFICMFNLVPSLSLSSFI